MDWKTVEMMGYAYYSERGYRILVSLVDNTSYDFVAEKDGVFLRVNAKVASIKDTSRSNSWSIAVSSGSSGRLDKERDVDVFLAYIPDTKKFLELPGDFFSGTKSKSRHIPVKMLK
jgi:hypothetical protein